MPPVNNAAQHNDLGLKEAADGRMYLEVDDPNDVYAGKMKTNPTTGTETFEEWPMAKPEDEPDPLLDLEQAWVYVLSDTPLPSKQELKEDVTAQNAAILVKELKYYIMSSTKKPGEESEDSENGNGVEESHPVNGNGVTSSSDFSRARANTLKLDDDERNEPLQSVYGASILLKLQCEDKSVQKLVPKMTYSELALFISDVYLNLESAFQEDERIAQVVLDTFAYEMTCLIMARYLDGIETCTNTLEESCFALLQLCAEKANPKEMHLSFKGFVSKIDAVYMEATAYIVLQPLLQLWSEAVVRISRKRRAFVQDLVKTYDRLFPSAESFEVTFVPENGVGTEAPGRINRVQDTVLKFAQKLTKKQLEQREKEVSIRLKVDMLGREKLQIIPSTASNPEAGQDLTEEEVKEQKRIEKDANDIAKDWVGERAVTLSAVLQMQTIFWRRLPPPNGEQRNAPKKKTKARKQKGVGSLATCPVSDEEKEQALCKSIELFKNLGWTNPVLVCQLAWNGLNLTPVRRADELMREHIGTDIRSRKEKKSTLYSMASVGHYLCSALRAGTIHRLNGGTDALKDEYAVDLSGSSFELLDPEYALDLVLPYLMAVIPQVVVSTSLAGILILKAFLERIPSDRFQSIADVLRLRCGTSCMARDASLLGVAHHLAKAVSMLDDPLYRRTAYETLQLLLRKCNNALARYVMTEYLLFESSRVAVIAQLVTEMKDSLRFSDSCVGKGADWTEENSADLRQRFALVCLPRFLTPKKNLLRDVNPIMTTVNGLVYVAIRDKVALSKCNDELLAERIRKGMKFSKSYGLLGRECIRALASVAEHDRRNLPNSSLAKKSSADAQALFAASGKTLNQCVAALSSLDLAMECLTE